MARPTVVLDLAGSDKLARDLIAGGVFVPGCTVGINEDCDLLVRAGQLELRVQARVVWVDGTRGAGLQLECDADARQHLVRLAQGVAPAPAAASPATRPAAIGSDRSALEVAKAAVLARTRTPTREQPAIPASPRTRTAATTPPTAEPVVADAELDAELARAALAESGADGEPQTTDDDSADGDTDEERKVARNIHERLRNLPMAQQLKLAHQGEVQERIILERMYGKTVWEALLRNPRITAPEVARIARMGALPRTLIEIIVNNGGWLQIPEVRRALLSNPRLGTDQAVRVLRLMPKPELKLAMIQSAYPHAVREAARRLVRGDG